MSFWSYVSLYKKKKRYVDAGLYKLHLSHQKDINIHNSLKGIFINLSPSTIKEVALTSESELLDWVVTVISHESLHKSLTETCGEHESRSIDQYLQGCMKTVRALYVEKDGITPKNRETR